jgi:quinol monooxygenase YgiN
VIWCTGAAHLVRAWRHEYLGGRSMFGLCVRFTCKDETSAEAYDRLVAETIEAINAHEPGTIVYASHLVDGQPLQRIFYELYRDEDAFHAHEAAPHTRRYLDERDQYLAGTEVDWLTLQIGKGTGG